MIVLTGASGYLGSAILTALQYDGCQVVSLGRSPIGGIEHRYFDLREPNSARELVEGASAIVHCAGIAHNLGAPEDYDQVNRKATLNLADAAIAAGVKRFIFISTLNLVPCEAASPDQPVAKWAKPKGGYEASKWQAESDLEQLLQWSDCQLTIIRPALVYDTELVANLALLQKLSQKIPVQLPGVGRRSMVSRQDVAALVVACLNSKSVAQQTVRIAATDGACYSARDISGALAAGRAPALSVPSVLWRFGLAFYDLARLQPPDSTWGKLAVEHWCGPVQRYAGWSPAETLGDVCARAQANRSSQ